MATLFLWIWGKCEIRKGEKISRTQNSERNILSTPFADEERLRTALQQHILNVPVRSAERLQRSRLQLQLLHRPIRTVSEQESSLFAAEHPMNMCYIFSVLRVFQFLCRDLLWELQFLWVFEGRSCTGNRPISNTLSIHKSLIFTTELKLEYW